MRDCIKPEFLDVINYSICLAVNEYLDEGTTVFFKKVGEYHLDEAMRRGLVRIERNHKPLDNLIEIARYLESTGYMERIVIERLSEDEALVEMHGVSVTASSVRLLKDGKHPSHFMTNIMLAALGRLGIQAKLTDVAFDEEARKFKEHWKILKT